ncbi:hypothetical protein FJZ36_09495 [Candidatus Poribacteria bacterium]|nr:hypothetical protein [Candidatus Poribacteria bacterium]
MSRVVVDTNVPVVANGRSDQASPGCVASCIQRIARIREEKDCLVLDAEWEIIGEYSRNLRSEGQPGVGDAFLLWVLTNRTNPERCHVVALTPKGDRNYVEFPTDPDLNRFDPSDRKFVAVARASRPRARILQAVDANWWHFREALHRNGVRVDFICADDIQRLIQ